MFKENFERGCLSDGKDNRYWSIKLSKVSWHKTLIRYNILNKFSFFVKKIIGILFFVLLLIPISIVAIIISLMVTKRTKKEVDESRLLKALDAYKEFKEVYPVRVYSPVTKSLELGLINECNLRYPALEIAVGDGHLSSLVYKDKDHKLAIGSDMIYETILSAKKYPHIGQFVVFDAEEIPLPDNSVKTVLMNNLMHHLPSRERILKEVERVLEPGGQFIFNDNLFGWIEYTFDSSLLRFLHLNFIARMIESFKLRLFAQKLLNSTSYWEEAVKGTQMEVSRNKHFVSKQTMVIGSIFEYLNLLQGQPTRDSMRLILKLGFLRRFLENRFDTIIRYLIINDEELLKDNIGAYLFVVLTKKGENISREGGGNLKYVCPKCKKDLEHKEDKFICKRCSLVYPIRKNIPIFLSYYKKLNDFDQYLDISDKKGVREYIT